MIDTQVAGSPGWWFERLAKQLVARQNRLDTLSDYLKGNAPLPEGAEGFRETYRAFQKKARTNFPELIVEAVQERMTVAGFRIEDTDIAREANRIWSVNEMATASTDVHGDMLGLSVGYAMVGPNGPTPTITYEDPACVVTDHDPLLPSRVRAALKLYRDDEAGKEFAFVYLPGKVYKAERDVSDDPINASRISQDLSGFDWVRSPDGTAIAVKLPAPVVPVVRFLNRKGFGEFETHTDILGRIDLMVLQRLVIVMLQAFRQRAAVGDFPPTDEAGTPIDYGSVFKYSPAAMWLLQEGQSMWESSYTDITPILSGEEKDIRMLAAVTGTPMSVLLPDSQNQSAEGAAAARERLVKKAKDRIQRATYGWNTVMEIALAFAGYDGVNVETEWLDPEQRSLAERADAASKLAPTVPRRTLWTDVLQFPPDKADRMEQERMDDSLSDFMQQPVTANGTQ